MKLSRLTKTSLLLAVFFALDKGLALLRQVIIARQFGFSSELDAFNVANNIPDLLFALISGGALAMALIPVLTDTLTTQGRPAAWNLFSRIANLAFVVTGVLALIVALLAGTLVRSQIGVAPGFGPQQQDLVITLMRLNLIATLIFSLSGLVMAGLQANQHFLLPAMAPALYNLGQIFGALVLAPSQGVHLGPLTLPTFGLGVNGLVYGVILGAVLHLGIQIPGLIKYQFQWTPKIGLKDPKVLYVLGLLGPRLLTMFFVQVIFLARDNLASRLVEGAVSALTYGWMIMQVPETLIGTAVGTAMLPTLAELLAKGDTDQFRETLQRASRVLIALSLPVAAVLGIGLGPLAGRVFGLDSQATDLLMWATRGYLFGLAGQCLLEVMIRSFYARQKVWIPLLASFINATFFILIGVGLLTTGVLHQPLGAAGISLADSIAFTSEAILLLVLLNRWLKQPLELGGSLLRGLLAAGAGGAATWFVFTLLDRFVSGYYAPFTALAAMALGVAAALPLIWREARQLLHL